MNFSGVVLYLSDGTIRISIIAQFSYYCVAILLKYFQIQAAEFEVYLEFARALTLNGQELAKSINRRIHGILKRPGVNEHFEVSFVLLEMFYHRSDTSNYTRYLLVNYRHQICVYV